jgi:hypothetical protein
MQREFIDSLIDHRSEFDFISMFNLDVRRGRLGIRSHRGRWRSPIQLAPQVVRCEL